MVYARPGHALGDFAKHAQAIAAQHRDAQHIAVFQAVGLGYRVLGGLGGAQHA